MTKMPENIRPWGRYDIYENAEHFQLKKIEVLPGKRNSYQSHKQRSEIWVVVQGQCTAVLNDKEVTAGAGEFFSIPQGTKHRFWNKGTQPVLLIEVQTGTYFGEDDVERFEDDFGRQGPSDPIWDTDKDSG